MNSPEHLPSETHKPITGYLWGALAVLTCPCHLPILAIVLAGTTAGAFIGEHWGIAALCYHPTVSAWTNFSSARTAVK